MTTGKPQQMAAESNSSDDLIAELSKLMAQDAQGSRQDVKPPQPKSTHDFTVRSESPPAGVTPFAVRIPGAAPVQAPEATTAAPSSRFDFGRPVEPVATVPRQEPSFAPAAVAAEPVAPPQAAVSTDEPAPFNFDFNFGHQSSPEPKPAEPTVQQAAAEPEPAPVRVPTSAPEPVAVSSVGDEHDTIADLIAAELMGELTSPTPVRPTSVEPAVVAVAPATTEAPAAQPEPVKVSEPVKASAPAGIVKSGPSVAWSPTAVTPNVADRPAQSRPTLRPVNLTPVQKSEPFVSDSFRIPPVFGLGTTPPPAATNAPEPVAPIEVAPAPEPVVAAPAPKPRAEHGYLSPLPVPEPTMAPPANDVEADRDPIDEIESLIGRAVRVELDSVREQQQANSVAPVSALRTLAAPTHAAPRPMSGVDEAILAAAAATGAEIGWVNQEDDQPSGLAPRRERAPRRGGMLRSVAGPLVAVALLLAAGFGLYSVLGLGGTDGPAPVLVADTAPIKQVPEAKGPVEQLQQSIVFNEMDGVVPGAEEQLVSRDQADVNEVTAIPPAAAAVTDEGLANRKVRTVTVRPDGTIVSGDDSVAGAAILPVDRPNVPAVPGAETASPSLIASANATQPTPAAVPAEPVAVAAPVVPLVPGTEIAVVDATGAPVAGKTAPVPYVRPASVGDAPATGPVNAVVEAPQASLSPASGTLPPAPAQNNLAAAITGANAQQPVQAEAAIAPATSNAPAYAQLSSQRSAEVAQQIANDLSARYAPLLNGAQLEVSRADLGERGTYYRVRVPAASRASAAQFCASVVANGGECVAM